MSTQNLKNSTQIFWPKGQGPIPKPHNIAALARWPLVNYFL